jgi:hypothetical protein
LSALRGNVAAVEYLAIDLGADRNKKDRNGFTPLELSLSKQQMKTEWALRRINFKSTLTRALSVGLARLKDPNVLMFLFCGFDDWELRVWPWRIVFISNLLGSVLSMMFAVSDSMGDLYSLHLLNTMVQLLWWLSFFQCLHVSPAFVRDGYLSMNEYSKEQSSANWQSNDQVLDREDSQPLVSKAYTYADVLELIASSVADDDDRTKSIPTLCHSCRVVRPLRSKHCRQLRHCVLRVRDVRVYFKHICRTP